MIKSDMLSGKLWNKILLFALPVAATAILEQLFNASDVAIVGNFTGELKTVAVAAVGANGSIINLIINFFVGFALGANVVISKCIGEGNEDGVRRAVHTSVVLSVMFGVVIAAIGEIVAPYLLQSLNVPEDVLPYSTKYLRIYLLGMPVILLYNFEAAIFRSIGQTKLPLIALAVSGAINVLLNLFFVIVLKMDVDGVAVATVVSNALSSIILFIVLLKTNKPIKVRIKELRIYKDSFKGIIRIGFPSGLQGAVFSFSNIVIQSAINSLGATVMAASGAAYNLEIIAYFVINSFSQACTTFTGQNYGARQFDRCKKILGICLLEDLIATAISAGLILLAGKPLLAIFNGDPEVISLGYTRLVVIFSAYIFSMLYEIAASYLRGYGISLVPAILTIIGVCGIRIVWIYTVFKVYSTFISIMIVYPVSLGTTAIFLLVALLIYRPSKKLKEKTFAAENL